MDKMDGMERELRKIGEALIARCEAEIDRLDEEIRRIEYSAEEDGGWCREYEEEDEMLRADMDEMFRIRDALIESNNSLGD